MKRMIPLLTTSLLLTAATAVSGQATKPAADREHSRTSARADAKKTEADVTYGRVKEFTAGQKIVINVDNAPDKSFDMTDKDVKVKLGKGLKVGDPVKVVEHEVLGKTKTVMITKHTGVNVSHGDKDSTNKKP